MGFSRNAEPESSETADVRSTAEVLKDHLEQRSKGALEADIERNYHPDLVLMHVNGVERGHSGMRKSGRKLKEQLPDMNFDVKAAHVHGKYGYIEWSARSHEYTIADGADSFVIEGGKIVFQTIHYTLQRYVKQHDQR